MAQVYDQMKQDQRVEPNTRTLNTVVRALAAGHAWEKALQVAHTSQSNAFMTAFSTGSDFCVVWSDKAALD